MQRCGQLLGDSLRRVHDLRSPVVGAVLSDGRSQHLTGRPSSSILVVQLVADLVTEKGPDGRPAASVPSRLGALPLLGLYKLSWTPAIVDRCARTDASR